MVRLDGGTPGCAQAAGKLYVLLLDGDSFGMDGTQVRIVEEADKESFGGLLQRLDSLALPTIGAAWGGDCLLNLSDLCAGLVGFGWKGAYQSRAKTYEALERGPKDEQIGRLLVATDLAQRDGAGLVALLGAVGRGSCLANWGACQYATACLWSRGSYVAWCILCALNLPCRLVHHHVPCLLVHPARVGPCRAWWGSWGALLVEGDPKCVKLGRGRGRVGGFL
jgi:hypothetical protein